MKIVRYSLLFLLLVFAGCSGSSSGGGSVDTGTPTIKNLALNMEPYDSETGLAGDFDFPTAKLREALIFTVFGDVLSGTTLNPTFEYKAKEGSSVTSISDGTVVSIGYDSDNSDYSVGVTPTDASSWLISYDHVLDVAVAEGAAVSSGDVIGKIGTWYGGIGRTEIQIFKESNGLSYCPFTYFDSSLTDEYQNKILQLMNDWEDYMDDDTIFDEDSMVLPGCLSETIQG